MTDGERAMHRLLADPSRARVLEALHAAAEPVAVAQLAAELRLHPNTIRWHLGHLAEAGLVEARRLAAARPGRPASGYVATARAHAPEPPAPQTGERAGDEYRFLATILAGTLEATPEGVERAEEAGRAWGRFLVERPRPFTATDEGEAEAQVRRLLDEQGFAPEGEGAEVRMLRCPFAELAGTHGDVVCGVHRGLVDGALEELRAPVRVESLEPFAEPGVCVLRLGRPAA